jgi:hypothetical protein
MIALLHQRINCPTAHHQSAHLHLRADRGRRLLQASLDSRSYFLVVVGLKGVDCHCARDQMGSPDET